MSNIWKSLNLLLINCEIELDLACSKDCIISEILNIAKVPANAANPLIARLPEGCVAVVTFEINSTKLYGLLVTLPINEKINFLENIKQGFKRPISWNKYRCGLTTKLKNNNLDYMIDPAFRNDNRLFVLSFTNGGNDTSDFFDKYYMQVTMILQEILLISITCH